MQSDQVPNEQKSRKQLGVVILVVFCAGVAIWLINGWRTGGVIKTTNGQVEEVPAPTEITKKVVDAAEASIEDPFVEANAPAVIAKAPEPSVVKTIAPEVKPTEKIETVVEEALLAKPDITAPDVGETLIEPKPTQELVVEEPTVQDVIKEIIVAKPIPKISDPIFELVRVDAEGSAVIAGKAEPNASVIILGNDIEIGRTVAGSDGNFVALLDVPRGDTPTVLKLQSSMDTGARSESFASFLVMPIGEEAVIAPLVVAAGENGITIEQAQKIDNSVAPEVASNVTLDTIDYSADGDVVFSGRGITQQSVRIYVDNQPVQLGDIEDGRWSLSLPNVDEGIYTVRVDAIDEAGKVTSRVESPFKREIPTPGQLNDSVTIQPGFTLWQLAEQKYGSGQRFVQIYDANRDSIKNPDLIYPGQVFALPE